MKGLLCKTLLAVLVVSNAAWMLLSIDSSHARQQLEEESARRRQTAVLLSSLMGEVGPGAPMEDVFSRLTEEHRDLVVNREGQTIEVGDVVLHFRNGVFERVTTM